jgi:hypothetical protein
MQHRSYPTRPPTPSAPAAPAVPAPEPALHLLHGLWVGSCPTCGFQLASARSQARCERRAARRRCPVCHLEER